MELELVQVIKRVTSGPVKSPLQKFGRWMLMTADNGEIRLLELNQSDEKNPVRDFASDQFENRSGRPAYLLTEGSNLWIASQGISRFRIQRTLGQFKRDDIIDYADTFLTPLAKLDESILHVRRAQIQVCFLLRWLMQPHSSRIGGLILVASQLVRRWFRGKR